MQLIVPVFAVEARIVVWPAVEPVIVISTVKALVFPFISVKPVVPVIAVEVNIVVWSAVEPVIVRSTVEVPIVSRASFEQVKAASACMHARRR